MKNGYRRCFQAILNTIDMTPFPTPDTGMKSRHIDVSDGF